MTSATASPDTVISAQVGPSAEEIARDLALMDEMEIFAQSLPKRSEGKRPSVQEVREMAYEDREARLS